jgi:hypothetical protein
MITGMDPEAMTAGRTFSGVSGTRRMEKPPIAW